MFIPRYLQYNYLGPSYQYDVIVMRDVVDLTIFHYYYPYILLFIVIMELENRKFSTFNKCVFPYVPFVVVINTGRKRWETVIGPCKNILELHFFYFLKYFASPLQKKGLCAMVMIFFFCLIQA